MKPVLAALLFLLLALVVLMALGTALFIGLGALLARWLPLSLFEAAGLAIGATLTLAAISYVLVTIMRLQQPSELADDPDPDLWETDTALPKPGFSKVTRNHSCPCGSGKKFKNCCGLPAVR